MSIKSVDKIDAFYGVFFDGKPTLIIRWVFKMPVSAIPLLNGLVGLMADKVNPTLPDGHYFAWDYKGRI